MNMWESDNKKRMKDDVEQEEDISGQKLMEVLTKVASLAKHIICIFRSEST